VTESASAKDESRHLSESDRAKKLPTTFMSARLYNRLSSIGRLVVLLAAYSAILFLSLVFALLLRFDFQVGPEYWGRFWKSIVWILPLKLVALALFGQFRTLLTYFSLPDAKRIAAAMGISSLIATVVWFALGGTDVIPRGVIVSDMVISFLGLTAFRTSLRVYREKLAAPAVGGVPTRKRRAAILGAGSAGAALLRDIQGRQGLGLDVVCFVDDDRAKIGGTLHGKQVLGPMRKLASLVEELDLQKIIIAMPTAKPAVIKRLVEQINALGIDHDILPSVAQLLHRQVTVSHLRRVDPEDLLGREAVALDQEGINSLIKGKTVMVTGAGGSIGSELCRQIAEQNPARLILVERSEPALFAIEQELLGSHRHVDLVARASSVCDEESIARIFAQYRLQLVFHAAAHKHVPLMENQPAEALRNNSIGTEIVARLASVNGAAKFILVSTDKAVNPTNVMGASKRLAELLLEQKSASETGCAFAAVRFGNVLGSSGSVVPTFRRQIAAGGPLTVTHPDVTRYFMSIPEAVGLILQSALQAKGGEIFVLDMGEPVKIVDLARQMIELSGFKPDEDIKIEFIGLRPGEKLYEEPIHEMENVELTGHPKVRRLSNNRSSSTGDLVAELQVIYRESAGDNERIKAWLAEKIPEYRNGLER
jgi:FlaA1/EpsC-like NDP-sugar epimerase